MAPSPVKQEVSIIAAYTAVGCLSMICGAIPHGLPSLRLDFGNPVAPLPGGPDHVSVPVPPGKAITRSGRSSFSICSLRRIPALFPKRLHWAGYGRHSTFRSLAQAPASRSAPLASPCTTMDGSMPSSTRKTCFLF